MLGLDEVVGGEEETTGAAGGVAGDLAWLPGHDIPDGADEGTLVRADLRPYDVKFAATFELKTVSGKN